MRSCTIDFGTVHVVLCILSGYGIVFYSDYHHLIGFVHYSPGLGYVMYVMELVSGSLRREILEISFQCFWLEKPMGN